MVLKRGQSLKSPPIGRSPGGRGHRTVPSDYRQRRFNVFSTLCADLPATAIILPKNRRETTSSHS